MAKHITKTRGPASVLTSCLYLVPAGLLVAKDPVAAAAFVLLAAGTLLYHGTKKDWGLDAAGMLSAMGALIGLPFGWLAQLVGAVGGGLLRPYYNHTLVASLFVPVSIVALTQGEWLALVLALAVVSVAFVVWRRPGDWPHAVWHIGTAVAMTTLALALA